jgi:uncharacterized membrane protein
LKTIRPIILVLLTLAVLAGAWMMLRLTLPYLSFRYDVDFLLTKQGILHVDIWRWSFYTHITTSFFVLLFGVFQFFKVLQTRYAGWHRALGKVYVLLVVFISAPSGLVMGFYANGGILAKTSFVIISLLWWWFTFKAYLDIRKRNILSHRANMMRSYALTLSALSLRLYVLVLPFIIHMHAKEMYTLVAWLSWVPNLLVAEWIVRRKKLI